MTLEAVEERKLHCLLQKSCGSRSAAKNVELDMQRKLEEIFPSRLKNWLTRGLELQPKKLLMQFDSRCAYRSGSLYMSNYLMASFSSLTNGNTEYGLIAQAKQKAGFCDDHTVLPTRTKCSRGAL